MKIYISFRTSRSASACEEKGRNCYRSLHVHDHTRELVYLTRAFSFLSAYGTLRASIERVSQIRACRVASHGRGSSSIILQKLTRICTCALSMLRSTARPLDALPHDGGLAVGRFMVVSVAMSVASAASAALAKDLWKG